MGSKGAEADGFVGLECWSAGDHIEAGWALVAFTFSPRRRASRHHRLIAPKKYCSSLESISGLSDCIFSTLELLQNNSYRLPPGSRADELQPVECAGVARAIQCGEVFRAPAPFSPKKGSLPSPLRLLLHLAIITSASDEISASVWGHSKFF